MKPPQNGEKTMNASNTAIVTFADASYVMTKDAEGWMPSYSLGAGRADLVRDFAAGGDCLVSIAGQCVPTVLGDLESVAEMVARIERDHC
jgi:hypothetical protein